MELVVAEPAGIESAGVEPAEIEPIGVEPAEVEPFEDEVDYEPTPEHADYSSDIDPSVEGSYEAPSDGWIEEVDAGRALPHSPVEHPGSDYLSRLFYLISNLQFTKSYFVFYRYIRR
jgi:hypothetical protein